MSYPLWFKGEFVAAILSGEKRDTIRKASPRLPTVGDVVAFSVGPRYAFARATIERVEPVAQAAIERERLGAVTRCLGETNEPLVKLTFSLVAVPRHPN